MIVACVIDVFTFMIVDGVFKQLLRSVFDDWEEKRSLWMKESIVLSVLCFIYLCFDHFPYLLIVLTFATYIFTQHPSLFTSKLCSTCDNPRVCSCKVPGNVSFRSPLPKNAYLGRGRMTNGRLNTLVGASATPLKSSISNGSEKMTPFDAFKGSLKHSSIATSTPFGRRSELSLPATNISAVQTENSVTVWSRKVSLAFEVVHHWLRMNAKIDYLKKWLSNCFYPPVVQTRFSSKNQTSLSAIKASALLICSCKANKKQVLAEYINENVSGTQDMAVALKLIAKSCELLCDKGISQSKLLQNFNSLFGKAKMADVTILQPLLLEFPFCFSIGMDDEVYLSECFEKFVKEFLMKVDVETRQSDLEDKRVVSELRVQMKMVAKQCLDELERCQGVFSGEFHVILGRLSMAQWILEGTKQGGKSLVSSNFEGQLAETTFCSSCDSFSYNFKKFTVIDLDILVAPSNQVRTITTLDDCLHYLMNKRRVRRSGSFQCVCYDEFMQQINAGTLNRSSGPRPEQDTSFLATSPRQVSFADEAGDEFYPGGEARKEKDESPKTLSNFVHYSRKHFSQLPKFLILNLNRFAPDERSGKVVKTINHLRISKRPLDLYTFTVTHESKLEYPAIEVDRSEFKYHLTCLVAHNGYSYSDGEYITYLRAKIDSLSTADEAGDDLWLKFDNTGVHKVNINFDLSSKFVRENTLIVVYEKFDVSSCD